MPDLIPSTSASLAGPWLLPRKTLLELDAVLDREEPTLTEVLERAVDRSVEETLVYMGTIKPEDLPSWKQTQRAEILRREQSKKVRQIVVTFDSGKRLEAERFSEALRMPELFNEAATSFALDVRFGPLTGHVAARPSFDSADLEIRTAPDTEAAARQLYAALQDWARGAQPAPHEKTWLRLRFWGWVLFIMFCGFWLGIKAASSYSAPYKQQARALLDKGVTASDEPKAIELLLAMQSDYSPKAALYFTKFDGVLLTYALFLSLLMSRAPRVVLGIGSGEGKIDLMRKIGKFAFVTVPLFVAGLVAKPWIEGLFNGWLGK